MDSRYTIAGGFISDHVPPNRLALKVTEVSVRYYLARDEIVILIFINLGHRDLRGLLTVDTGIVGTDHVRSQCGSSAVAAGGKGHKATIGVHSPVPVEGGTRADIKVVAEPGPPLVGPSGRTRLLKL